MPDAAPVDCPHERSEGSAPLDRGGGFFAPLRITFVPRKTFVASCDRLGAIGRKRAEARAVMKVLSYSFAFGVGLP